MNSLTEQERAAELAKAITLAEMVKTRVLADLETNHSGISAKASAHALETLKSSALIGNLVNQELHKRIKRILVIGIPILSALGWVSIQEVISKLKSQAGEEAASVVQQHLQTLNSSIEKHTKAATETLDAKSKSAIDSFEKRILDLRQDSREIEDRIRKVRQDSEERASAKLSEMATTAEARKATFKEDIEKLAVRQQQFTSADIENKRVEALKDIADQIRKISEAGAVELSRIERKTREIAATSSGTSQTKRPTKREDEEDDIGDTMYLEMMVKRQYDTPIPKAKAALSGSKPTRARSLLEPLIVRPGLYSAAERQEAIRILFSPTFSVSERYTNITEITMPAARLGDTTMLDPILGEMNANLQYGLNQNDLVEFGISVLRRDPKSTLETKFHELKLDTLTARGLSNVMILAKRNNLSPARILEVESLLIEKMLDPELINSTQDYLLCHLYLEALEIPPVADKSNILKLIKRMESFLFSGRFEALDPWKVKEKIIAVRKLLSEQ